MKNTAIIAYMAASAAVASATGGEGGGPDTGGVIINPDGSYTCETPNAAYCAGDSLKTDIIIRCYGTRGQAGRCSNNLAGEPPVGNFPSLCYQTDNEAGDAACEKNCVVYGASGNGNGTFTLPAEICTPTYTATSSIQPSTSSNPSYPIETSTSEEYPPHSSKTPEYPPHYSSKTHVYPPPPPPPSTSKDCSTESETVTPTYPTAYPTSIHSTGYDTTTTSVYSPPPYYPSGNNTFVPSSKPTNPPPVTYPTAPVSPPPATTTTANPVSPPPPVEAGAVHNSVVGGAALALVGFIAAFIL